MRIETVSRKEFTENSRLDSSYYLSDGALANRLVNALSKQNEYIQLGNKKIANIWQPNRNIIVYAGENEEYVPYIQPYDILEYLPEERSRLSTHQNDIDALSVKEGTILQTCSGRNLGPLVIADKYLERFILGSDLIRISIEDECIKYYVYAFLNTDIGQALLHSSKTGSVIDHLSIKDVEKIKIPLVNREDVKIISEKIRDSFLTYSKARMNLYELKENFVKTIGVYREQISLAQGWGCMFSSLGGKDRIDAAYYDPATKVAVRKLKADGGIELVKVAEVIKPGGRYKTNYVEKGYGKPLISGRQLLQNHVVGMKYLPYSNSADFEKFELKEGYIAYPADGRVEGRLGTPVYISQSRAGWYASGHVGRVKAKDGIDPGYLYMAMIHPVVQAQIYSIACGSVVDAVYPDDMEKIIIPKAINFPYEQVVEAWDMFDKAEKLKIEACEMLSKLLKQKYHSLTTK